LIKMSQNPASGPEWYGDMLDSEERVALFAAQLRRNIASQAEVVAAIRRDAEAMWAANPPAGYGSFEAWWRHRWVRGPMRDIQELLEKAAASTHALEARYRRGRHEIPARRLAAAERKELKHQQHRPPLHQGRHAPAVTWEDTQDDPGYADQYASTPSGTDFMDMVRERRRRSA
jgi:hypothetical protein